MSKRNASSKTQSQKRSTGRAGNTKSTDIPLYVQYANFKDPTIDSEEEHAQARDKFEQFLQKKMEGEDVYLAALLKRDREEEEEQNEKDYSPWIEYLLYGQKFDKTHAMPPEPNYSEDGEELVKDKLRVRLAIEETHGLMQYHEILCSRLVKVMHSILNPNAQRLHDLLRFAVSMYIHEDFKAPPDSLNPFNDHPWRQEDRCIRVTLVMGDNTAMCTFVRKEDANLMRLLHSVYSFVNYANMAIISYFSNKPTPPGTTFCQLANDFLAESKHLPILFKALLVAQKWTRL